MRLNNIYLFLLKYGFLLVLFGVCDVYAPDFNTKIVLSSMDLSTNIATQSGSNWFRQVFWGGFFVFYLTSFMIFRAQRPEYLPFIKRIFLLWFIAFVCILSAIWSNYSTITIKRGIFQFMFITVVSLSAFYAVVFDTFYKNFKVCSCIVLVMIGASVFLGVGFTTQGALAGYFDNKNTLGGVVLSLLACLIVFGSSTEKNELLLKWFLVLGLFCCLILSASKTNLFILFFLSILYFTHIYIVKFTAVSLFISLSALFVLLPLSQIFIGEYVVFSDFVSTDFITGRGIIWKTIYYDLYVFDKLYLGYGYGGFFGVPEIPYYFDDTYSFLRFINSSHNGYIELLTQFGVCFGSIIIYCFYRLIKTVKSKAQVLLLIIPVLQNVTESTLLKDNGVYWLLFIVAIIHHTLPNKFEFSRDNK